MQEAARSRRRDPLARVGRGNVPAGRRRRRRARRSSPWSVGAAARAAVGRPARRPVGDASARERTQGAPQQAELERLARLRRAAIALPASSWPRSPKTRSHCLAAWEQARRDRRLRRVFAKPFASCCASSSASGRRRSSVSDDLYDGLLDEHEPGMRRVAVGSVAARQRASGLRTLVPANGRERRRRTRRLRRAAARERRNSSRSATRCSSTWVSTLTRGRLDRSTHPFTTMAGDDDVRLTIRRSSARSMSAIFATLHEGGHALYDQGLPRELHGTLLADGRASGVHESQARLWENHVGRSAAFWRALLREAAARVSRRVWPGWTRAACSARINVVAPSVNRVAADEATYNLHMLVRYELELALLDGDLAVADLPGAWNERYRHYLGVTAARRARRLSAGRALGARRVRLFSDVHDRQPVCGAADRSVLRAKHDLDAQLRDRQSCARCALGSRASVYAHGAELAAEDLIEAATGAAARRRTVLPAARRGASRSSTTKALRAGETRWPNTSAQSIKARRAAASSCSIEPARSCRSRRRSTRRSIRSRAGSSTIRSRSGATLKK